MNTKKEIERFTIITERLTHLFKVDGNGQLWIQVTTNGVTSWSSTQDPSISAENHEHAVTIAKEMLFRMGIESEVDIQNSKVERH